MTEQMEWFKCRINWMDVIETLPDQEIAMIVRAITAFYRGREQPEMGPASGALWHLIRMDLEKDQAKREKAAEAHRKVGVAAGLERARRAEVLRTVENAPAAGETASPIPGNVPAAGKAFGAPVQVSGTPENAPAAAKESAKPVQAFPTAGNTPAPSSFTPPTLEEVRSYCREKQYRSVPEAFLHYYRSQGWKTGSGLPMKSWRDAMDMWEIREKSWKKPKLASPPLPAQQYSQRKYDEPEETLEEMMLRLNGGVLPVAET